MSLHHYKTPPFHFKINIIRITANDYQLILRIWGFFYSYYHYHRLMATYNEPLYIKPYRIIKDQLTKFTIS